MSNHDSGHEVGRASCDALLAHLRSTVPTAARKPGKAQCAFSLGGANIAYLLHRKTISKLPVYFPSTPRDSFERPGLSFFKRPTFGSAWADRFAWYFELQQPHESAAAASFLLSLNSRKQRGTPLRAEPLFAEEVLPDAGYTEGSVTSVNVDRYERDAKARAACIRLHGSICAICGFNFGSKYGEQFAGVITVHHLTPLSEIRREYRVRPQLDLRPLCANCHLIVHRRVPPFSIDEVKEMLRTTRDAAGACPASVPHGDGA